MSLVAIAVGGDPRFYGKFAAFGSDTIALGRVAGYADRHRCSQCASKCAACRLRSAGHGYLRVRASRVGSRGPLLGLVAGFAVLFLARLFSGGAGRIGRSWARRVVALSSSLSGQVCCLRLLWKRWRESPPTFRMPTRHVLVCSGRRYELFEDDPLAGGGTGSYAAYDPKFDYPHDLVLEVAAQNGIVAVVSLVGLPSSWLSLWRQLGCGEG